ncbi:cytochrome P450 family protein [Diplogelasinospora grovesii]|uniref:Cytochrome P450 family protein n=1 Tax=Diplogelasinospora grovesii TaxID=303347 RepID=A0AAN6N0J0_9PEZI|nr:cytochrome P450 family protein [Diplogelasinospora grovesii]
MALLNSTAVLGTVAALVLYFVTTRIAAWNRLRHIPGPPGVGWSKAVWMVPHQLSGRLCKDLEAVCDKYGPLARIGPEWVVCSDPAELRRIWSVHSGYQRAPWYNGFRFDPNRDNVITANENKEHHRLRSQLLRGYSGKGRASQDSEQRVIDEQILKFVGLIERKYLSDPRSGALRPMDMGRSFGYLMQDATSAVGFGEAFGYADSDEDSYGVIHALESMLLPTAMFALLPSLLALVKTPLAAPFMPRPTDPRGVGRLLKVIHERVEERYSSADRPGDNIKKKEQQAAAAIRDDALQSFVESGLSRDEVEAEALVFLLGGADTTATAIRNTIFYLTTNPAAYRTLQAEIDAAMGEPARAVARPVIADQQAKSLPFLQACIREGLRMWPPISGLFGKVSDRDDVICGRKVPAGTYVAWAALGAMKNRHVFGEDADVFEPRRWVEAEPERLRGMEATQGLVFAAGTRWECLGKRLAYMELGKVLFELFLRFDFAMVKPTQPLEWQNYGLTIHKNMNVRITRRGSVLCV